MTDIPTLANAAAPAADPGELGPPIERAAPKSTKPPETFEQRRHAQEKAAGADKPPATPEPQQPAPPAGDGEAKYKVGEKYEVTESELAAMMDRQAADDLRKATVPLTADDYKLEISPAAKLPGNAEFKFDGNDPGLIAAKAWAHSKGMDQGTFSEMLTLYASHEAQQNAALAEISRAEIAKAGVNAPQRVDAIGKWIRGEVGDADAKPILATIVTDAHLRFYEKLHHKITSQGSASFSQQHRVPPDDKTIPGYEGMSFEQRRFAQDQRARR